MRKSLLLILLLWNKSTNNLTGSVVVVADNEFGCWLALVHLVCLSAVVGGCIDGWRRGRWMIRRVEKLISQNMYNLEKKNQKNKWVNNINKNEITAIKTKITIGMQKNNDIIKEKKRNKDNNKKEKNTRQLNNLENIFLTMYFPKVSILVTSKLMPLASVPSFHSGENFF